MLVDGLPLNGTQSIAEQVLASLAICAVDAINVLETTLAMHGPWSICYPLCHQ
jgi:hypothetical protein